MRAHRHPCTLTPGHMRSHQAHKCAHTALPPAGAPSRYCLTLSAAPSPAAHPWLAVPGKTSSTPERKSPGSPEQAAGLSWPLQLLQTHQLTCSRLWGQHPVFRTDREGSPSPPGLSHTLSSGDHAPPLLAELGPCHPPDLSLNAPESLPFGQNFPHPLTYMALHLFSASVPWFAPIFIRWILEQIIARSF